MRKKYEELERITHKVTHMSYALVEMSLQIQELNKTIEELTKQLKELEISQQPIIVNPSPVWPAKIPTEPYGPWWEYTPITTSSTTMEIKNTGDA